MKTNHFRILDSDSEDGADHRPNLRIQVTARPATPKINVERIIKFNVIFYLACLGSIETATTTNENC